jgi:hypothetical protein
VHVPTRSAWPLYGVVGKTIGVEMLLDPVVFVVVGVETEGTITLIKLDVVD